MCGLHVYLIAEMGTPKKDFHPAELTAMNPAKAVDLSVRQANFKTPCDSRCNSVQSFRGGNLPRAMSCTLNEPGAVFLCTVL